MMLNVITFGLASIAHSGKIGLRNHPAKTTMTIDAASINGRTKAILKKSFYSSGGVVKTPLTYSDHLSKHSGCNVYLKCENLQTTGSFKLRGATSAILSLGDKDKRKGVITASSGNHGAATANAAQTLAIPVSIYVPTSISSIKEKKITDCGAGLIKIEGAGENAEREAVKAAVEHDAWPTAPPCWWKTFSLISPCANGCSACRSH